MSIDAGTVLFWMRRKLLSISLPQPQGRFRGDQERGEDPFRKKLAEARPEASRKAEAGNRLSIHKKHFINSLKPAGNFIPVGFF
ncbi:MAG: hypothetical protein EA344_03530 [Alkalicoccus sp.]|nr:MAG: hypothetical protein EA344_03530 [Alkalicoccus sp.]